MLNASSKVVSIVGIVVLSLSFFSAARADDEGGEGSLRCNATVFDFGKKDSREEISHTFVLENKGSREVRILNVDAPCGCTVAALSSQRIPGGGKLDVDVKFRLAGRSGPQEKKIFLDTSAGAKTIVLVMRGFAVSKVGIEPHSLYFGRVAQGKPAVETVLITTGYGVTFNVLGVTCDSKLVTATVETVKQGTEFKVHTTLDAAAPEGRLDAQLDISTDNKEYPVLHVPVSAQVVGELFVLPRVVELERGKAGAPKSVYVTAGQIEKFTIAEVRAPLERLKPQVLRFGEDGYRIVLRDLQPIEDLDGKELVIITNPPSKTPIRVPFKVTPPPQADAPR